MTPIEIAVNAACRVFCKQTDGPAFEELSPIQKFQVVEHEDAHLMGNRDVNAWFECPVDKDGPVA